MLISEITPVNKEQLTGTVATISCIVTGLTKVLDEVKWTKQDNTIITSGQGGYTIVKGNLVDGNSQTTTLRVDESQNNVDTTYNCLVTSHEHSVADKSTMVPLNVYCEIITVFLVA